VNLLAYEKQFGRQCPREDLDPDNGESADLLNFLTDERLRPLAHAMFESLCWDRSPADRVSLMRRAEAALCDPDVIAIMYPKPPEREG
jgi:hypothetical protein